MSDVVATDHFANGLSRIRPGSITSRLPNSLSAFAETAADAASASAAFERGSSRIKPRTGSRWRMTSSLKS
jgi:hypothetical protein